MSRRGNYNRCGVYNTRKPVIANNDIIPNIESLSECEPYEIKTSKSLKHPIKQTIKKQPIYNGAEPRNEDPAKRLRKTAKKSKKIKIIKTNDNVYFTDEDLRKYLNTLSKDELIELKQTN